MTTDSIRRRSQCSDSQQILQVLTTRQHLHPHRTLDQVLVELCRLVGACPVAVDRAAEWLEIPRSVPVGRLRRTEMMQLSRAIHRFWTAALSAEG